MPVEWLIFFYMAVSILMGLFDFGFIAFERLRHRYFVWKARRMSKFLSHEIETNADFPTEKHLASLQKSLRRLSGLESFDLLMERFEHDEPDKSLRYLEGIASVFDRLTLWFFRKSALHQAYYSYLVRRWYRRNPLGERMSIALLAFVEKDSLYARQNALEALAKIAPAELLVEAIVRAESSGGFYHPKLVTEIAMGFSGESHHLGALFIERFKEFSTETQTAIVNYLRMKGCGTPDFFLELLGDRGGNREVHLACLRYFAQHKDARVVPFLREFALTTDPGQWEYAAVAASVLSSYLDESSIKVLVRCLQSPVWFVRFNAAKSLYDGGVTLDGPELAGIREGNDRYAQAMVRYRWDYEKARLSATAEATKSSSQSGSGD